MVLDYLREFQKISSSQVQHQHLTGIARLAAETTASKVEAVVGELGGDDPGHVELTVPGAADPS